MNALAADRLEGIFASLRAGAAGFACGGYLASLEPVKLHLLIEHLVYDRLEDKLERVNQIYRTSGQNWNQAFYTLLFRHVGAMESRDLYQELARRANYPMVLREKRSLPRIEALLMGTAGLLPTFRTDDYIRRLREDFDYFKAKYDIVPIDPKGWEKKGRPANKTYLRIAQLSSFLAQHNFVFDQVLACRTREDCFRLFTVEASTYWSEPSGEKKDPKRLGLFKTDVYGINLVAILQYAYGAYTGDEPLRERAMALLEHIPAENNKIVDRWKAYGIRPRNAYDTQGLLQLNEYCKSKRCEQCFVARQIIEKLNNEQ